LRDYEGTSRHDPGRIEKIDRFLREVARAMRRIQNNEVPDGSGTSLGGGVTDHGELTGLSDDDHAQYLHLPGRSGGQTILSLAAAENTVTIKGFAAQTGNWLQVQNSASNVKLGIGYRDTNGIGGYVYGAPTSGGDATGLGLFANSTLTGTPAANIYLQDSGLGSTIGFRAGSYAFKNSTTVGATSGLDLDGAESGGGIMRMTLNGYLQVDASGGAANAADPLCEFDNKAITTSTNRGVVIRRGGSGASVNAGDLLQFRTGTAETAGGGDVLLSRFDKDGVYFGPIASTSSVTFLDSLFRLLDDGDNTKKLAWQLSGLTTATTRTWTVQDADGTVPLLEAQNTWTNFNTFQGDQVIIGIDSASFTQILFIPDAATGFSVALGISGAIGADVTATIPATGGTLLSSNSTVNVTNKTLTTGNVLRVNTAGGTGTHFQDSGTTTKRLYPVLSNAVGNNSLTVRTTAARNYDTPDVSGFLPVVMFTQTADKTVANTTTETTLIGTGVGTLTLPANSLIAGRTVRIKMSGIYSTVAVTGGTVTVKVKYGSTVIATIATTALLTGATNDYWEGEVVLTCRTTGATGTVMTSGRVGYQITGNAVIWDELNNAGATTTIDTTAATALDVTVTWSAANASNTVTSLVGSLEVLN